jgi:ribosomal protein S18 acetylase RimI-like enzyme
MRRKGEKMGIELIDEDSKQRRNAALSALTLAFARDPIMRWLYPEPDAYLTHFPKFAGAFGGPSFGAGTAWAPEDNSGAALWFPSGVHPDGESIESVMLSTVEKAKHDTLGATLEKMDEMHPKEPHWYLAIIGVDSAHQGRGLGAQLMEGALARCDDEGLIAYLESSNPANISLYERHGFEVIDKIQIGDAPPTFPMQRPAR